jgi:hypothetical protein
MLKTEMCSRRLTWEISFFPVFLELDYILHMHASV